MVSGEYQRSRKGKSKEEKRMLEIAGTDDTLIRTCIILRFLKMIRRKDAFAAMKMAPASPLE